jgi:predicted dithiol-disulfide oxidoreductase (DUF899 family)
MRRLVVALPEVVSRKEWLEARLRLLEQEKEATRARTALNAERRRLPMVRIENEYVFDGPEGKATLRDLFGDQSQLIVQHVMFAPDWAAACPGCTAAVDVMSRSVLDQVRSRDTAMVLVSAAPLAKLQAYQEARGWVVPWYSSQGTDFNHDFQVTVDESQPWYNYQDLSDKVDPGESEEMPGYSCFVRDDGEVFHTYSVYARGAEPIILAYAFLDFTAFGRSEGWEEPQGRARHLHGADPTFTD